MPDARAGEAVDDCHAQLLRRAGRVLHLLDGPGVDAGRIAVAPDVRRQNRLVPLVDRVQHGLADQVIADREDLQVVALRADRAWRRNSRRRPAPCPPRNDRPSRPTRGRRSRSRWPCEPCLPTSRSAHWPVNSVTGRVMQFAPSNFCSLGGPICKRPFWQIQRGSQRSCCEDFQLLPQRPKRICRSRGQGKLPVGQTTLAHNRPCYNPPAMLKRSVHTGVASMCRFAFPIAVAIAAGFSLPAFAAERPRSILYC